MESEKQRVLMKLAGNHTDIMTGMVMMLHDEMQFKALDHAASLLLQAKGDHYLTAVESNLQATINEIKLLHAQKNVHMDQEKTALYLSTLQQMIFNLKQWVYEDGEQSHYQPKLIEKYNYAFEKGKKLGFSTRAINRACYNDQYQYAGRPSVQYFQLLDEKKMDEFAVTLERERLTQAAEKKKHSITIVENSNALKNPAQVDLGSVQLNDSNLSILDKVINAVKSHYGKAKISFAFITKHLENFFGVVGHVLNTRSRKLITRVTEAIVHRVLTLEQQIEDGIHQLSEHARAILEKITTIVRAKLGNAGLTVRYVLANLETVFSILGDTVHSADKDMIARIADAMMLQVMRESQAQLTLPAGLYVEAESQRSWLA